RDQAGGSGVPAEEEQAPRAVPGPQRREPVLFEALHQRLSDIQIVLDHQDGVAHPALSGECALGRRMTKWAPPGTGWTSWISPPCASTICRTTYSPSPRPPKFRIGAARSKRRKMRSRSDSAM